MAKRNYTIDRVENARTASASISTTPRTLHRIQRFASRAGISRQDAASSLISLALDLLGAPPAPKAPPDDEGKGK